MVCKYNPNVLAYKEASTPEQRATVLETFQHILTVRDHEPLGVYEEIKNWFTKQAMVNHDQFMIMTKPGLRPAYFPMDLEQHEHFAPKVWPYARTETWKAKNRFDIEIKVTHQDRDFEQFVKNEHYAQAMEADAFAYQQGFKEWWKMVISLLFMDNAKFKAWESTGAAEDGYNKEFEAIFFPTDGSTKGFPAYQQGLSIEKTFMPWKADMSTWIHPTDKTNVANAVPYSVKKNKYFNIIKTIRETLARNVIQSEATKIEAFTAKGLGSEEIAKWIGLLHKLKETVIEMTTMRTSKFHIGGKMNGANIEFTDTETAVKTLITDHKVYLGLHKEGTTNNNEVCGHNQVYAKASDLALFINPLDIFEMQKVLPVIENPGATSLDNIAKYIGIDKIFMVPEITKGSPMIISKKAMGFYPITAKYGTARHEEGEFTNRWIRISFHWALWPYHCVTVVKKA